MTTHLALNGIDVAAVIAEADRLHEHDPEPFFVQPSSYFRTLAEDLLPEDAPWHHVAHLAHALSEQQD